MTVLPAVPAESDMFPCLFSHRTVLVVVYTAFDYSTTGFASYLEEDTAERLY